jgi:hypothetical protein
MPATNAVEAIRLRAGPRVQIKAASYNLLFAVEMLQQRDELVTLDQNPVGVGD